jgi:hypothetical protein
LVRGLEDTFGGGNQLLRWFPALTASAARPASLGFRTIADSDKFEIFEYQVQECPPCPPLTAVVDDSDDVCHYCADGGELIVCSSCDKSFHIECLGLAVVPPEDDWRCPLCAEVPTSPAAPATAGTANTGAGAGVDNDIEIDAAEAMPSPSSKSTRCYRKTCQYGSSCYRKNADHLRDFFHPTPLSVDSRSATRAAARSAAAGGDSFDYDQVITLFSIAACPFYSPRPCSGCSSSACATRPAGPAL